MGNCLAISTTPSVHSTGNEDPLQSTSPITYRGEHISSPSYEPYKFRTLRPPSKEFLNGGYWASWKYHDGIHPSIVPLETITHVNYAFASIHEDGTVYLADQNLHLEADVDGANGSLRAWTQLKDIKPDLKIILAVRGSGEDVRSRFSEVASSEEKLITFAKSIKQLLGTYHLDGVDIDWEFPQSRADCQGFINMLTELRKHLDGKHWITTALPAGEWALSRLNLAQIANQVNFVNLMAYDFVGPTFKHVHLTGHHAALFALRSSLPSRDYSSTNGAGAVEYLIGQGVPSRKIMFGVPLYGHVFEGANDLKQLFRAPGKDVGSTYEVKDLPRPGMVETFDNRAMGVFASGNGNFITYDTKETVIEKAKFVKRCNLAGMFYWHLAGDRQGEASLVRGGYETLFDQSAKNNHHLEVVVQESRFSFDTADEEVDEEVDEGVNEEVNEAVDEEVDE